MANIEVLKQLRRVAEEAPEELLHMNAVVNKSATCGTARCLLGWAIVDPWFQKNTRINDALPADYMEWGVKTGMRKILREVFGFRPYSQDMPRLFAFHDFIGAHSVTKTMVLDNIDRLIRGEPAKKYT